MFVGFWLTGAGLFWTTVVELAVSSSPTGISTYACPHVPRSLQPSGTPLPAISPRLLIASVSTNRRAELGGINVFRSTIELFSHRNERSVLKSHDNELPTI